MATNTLVVYGMIMSYLNLRPESGFVTPALVIGTISIVGALWQGILDRFLGFLLLIGTFFVPVFAIMLADYWILKRGRYSVSEVLGRGGGAYWYTAGFNLPAWVAYVTGAGLAFYWTRVSPLSFGATVPVFFITFVLYLTLRFAADRLKGRQDAPETARRAG
jgi:NCS1 family nucleobase:cation symporter-1